MNSKEKLSKAIKSINFAIDELDGIAELLNDSNLEYSYTDISKAVGLLEKTLELAKSERGYDCPDCNGTGEVIAHEKIHSAIIDVPYKRCPNCGGSGEIEQD